MALEGRQRQQGVGLEEMYGLTSIGLPTDAEAQVGPFSQDQSMRIGGVAGLLNLQRLISTRRNYPQVTISSGEAAAQRDLGGAPGRTLERLCRPAAMLC